MAYPKGKKRPPNAGRRAGTPNKKKECVAEICERLGFNPFELLIHVAKKDFKALGYDTAELTKMTKDGGIFSEERINLDHRLKAAAQLTTHVAPVLKAIEHSGTVEVVDTERDALVEQMKLIAAKGRLKIEPSSSNS